MIYLPRGIDVKYFGGTAFNKVLFLLQGQGFHQLFIDIDIRFIHESDGCCRWPFSMIFANPFPCYGSQSQLLTSTKLYNDDSPTLWKNLITYIVQCHHGYTRKSIPGNKQSQKMNIKNEKNRRKTTIRTHHHPFILEKIYTTLVMQQTYAIMKLGHNQWRINQIAWGMLGWNTFTNRLYLPDSWNKAYTMINPLILDKVLHHQGSSIMPKAMQCEFFFINFPFTSNTLCHFPPNPFLFNIPAQLICVPHIIHSEENPKTRNRIPNSCMHVFMQMWEHVPSWKKASITDITQTNKLSKASKCLREVFEQAKIHFPKVKHRS